MGRISGFKGRLIRVYETRKEHERLLRNAARVDPETQTHELSTEEQAAWDTLMAPIIEQRDEDRANVDTSIWDEEEYRG